jgi:hypothetical protein
MGRMMWDLATLLGRAGWEADSDYTVDRSRLGTRIRACMPRGPSWTYRVAREALPWFQEHPSQPE